MKHHPDFYAEDDDRPQFGTLSFEKQQEIICAWLFHGYNTDKGINMNNMSYVIEAISQMKPDSTVSDLLLYIAKCVDKNYPSNEWTI